MNYETLFVRIGYLLKDNNEKNQLIRKEILIAANLNLSKLTTLSKKIKLYEITNSDNVKSYIRELTK